MGMFGDDSHEIDIVKEMAEGLGSQGIKVDELLGKAEVAKEKIEAHIDSYRSDRSKEKQSLDFINASIKEYNLLVEKAEDARRWLLIQREACGFRTHKHVDFYYPIPPRMRPLKE